jgi:hypothetical protein
VWDFAVELRYLRRKGLSISDLRWMACKGYVQHGREVTRQHEASRTFERSASLTFDKTSCFVLTTDGVDFARATCGDRTRGLNLTINTQSACCQAAANVPPATTPSTSHRDSHTSSAASRPVPHWDCDYREIRYDNRVVKQFKLPSPNQEAILLAFQEEGWPPRIDDPLPPHPHCDPKQRLHDTIRSLNRNQRVRLLRFKGDGTGQGILWEPIGGSGESAE